MPILLFVLLEIFLYSLMFRFFGFGFIVLSFFILWFLGISLMFQPGQHRKVSGFLLFLPFLTTRVLGLLFLIPVIRNISVWLMGRRFFNWVQQQTNAQNTPGGRATGGFRFYSSGANPEDILRKFEEMRRQGGPAQGPIFDVQGQERDVTPKNPLQIESENGSGDGNGSKPDTGKDHF